MVNTVADEWGSGVAVTSSVPSYLTSVLSDNHGIGMLLWGTETD